MNIMTFDQKINALKSFPDLNHSSIEKFASILSQLSDWELVRINPFSLAERHGFNKREMTDLLIHGVKVGLFEFAWNLICPKCGGIEKSLTSISEISSDTYHCVVCDIDVVADLSEYIEVSFNIHPAIKRIEIDPYSSFEAYMRYFFSANFVPPEGFLEFIMGLFHSYNPVEPDESIKVSFNAYPGQLFRIMSIENNCSMNLHFTNSTSPIPEIIDLDLFTGNFSSKDIHLPAGEITASIHNRTGKRSGIYISEIRFEEAVKYFEKSSPKFHDFLTGEMLLNSQSFRDLFHIQTLPNNFRLKVSDVTILFTDLKGSTELYERSGDVFAYNLVQDHFDLLKSSTKNNHGAIIKTIGDAVMASFNSPTDALLCAMDMVKKINEMNSKKEYQGHEIAIKVGIHTGTALAVTANETLDYFGRTVNIAARIQGLAGSSEIWMTDTIFNSEQAQNLLSANGYNSKKQSAMLKGVSTPVVVYQCAFC